MVFRHVVGVCWSFLGRAWAWLIADPALHVAAAPSHDTPLWRAKAREWLRRYAPLELVSCLTALIGAGIASAVGHPIVTAYGGAWGENVGYYGIAMARELASETPDAKAAPVSTRLSRAARRLIAEFGIAELADSFVVRPACMYAATSATGSLTAGVVIGKIAGDVVFYAIAIFFYERNKRS